MSATNNGTAAAYNSRFLDDLTLVELAYRGDIQGVNPPVDDVVTLGPDAPIFSWPAGFAIAPGASISFSFAVEVDGTVEPERILPTTIQADWTSLPGQTTALNRTGLIGPDGSATGMRIGAIPNAGDTLNDYEANVTATVPVAAVGVAKVDLDPTQSPEIGTHKFFEIKVRLPEGLTQDVIVGFEHRRAAGDHRLSMSDHRDDEPVPTVDGLPQLRQRGPNERRRAVYVRAHQDELTVRKFDEFGDSAALDEGKELPGGGFTGIDDEVDTEFLDLRFELGVLDACDLTWYPERGRGVAGEHVDCVGRTDRDEEVGVAQTRFSEGRCRRTIAGDDHAVDL